MSQRMTVGDLRSQSRVCQSLGLCEDDTERFIPWLNLAEERMLNQGRWWGSIQEMQLCVTSGCIVLPREVAAIEQVALCGQPIDLENQWYRYTRLLARLKSCSGGCSSSCSSSGTSGGGCSCSHFRMEDRGMACSFATTLGENKVLRIYPTSADDEGKKLIIQGRDNNNIWVRTVIDGTVQDGEQVTLALPYVQTTTSWFRGSPQRVLKDPTDYRVLVYSYDTSTTEERFLASYEPSETRPMYRTYNIPQFHQAHCRPCCTDDDGREKRTVTAIVGLQHVPVSSDNDWLVLQNLSAYKAAMQAMKAYEEGNVALGDYYFYGSQAGGSNARGVQARVNRGGAIPLLAAELRKMTGDKVNGFVYSVDETARPQYEMRNFW